MNPSRISRPVGVLMITIAAIVDFLQFILTLVPFVGWVFSMMLGVFATFLFGLWFAHYGISMLQGRRALLFWATAMGEMVPIIDGMPVWTFTVGYLVRYSRRNAEKESGVPSAI